MKYNLKYSNKFKKQVKKMKKRGKDIEKLINVVKILASGEKLEPKYKDHILFDIRLVDKINLIVYNQGIPRIF